MSPPNVVAVVGRNPKMLEALDRLLPVFGLYVETYASVESFMYGAAMTDATCALIDTPLDEERGFELLRRLRAGGFTVPFVFLIDSEEDTIRLQARTLKRVAFVHKPFFSEQLIEAIRSAMASCRDEPCTGAA